MEYSKTIADLLYANGTEPSAFVRGAVFSVVFTMVQQISIVTVIFRAEMYEVFAKI